MSETMPIQDSSANSAPQGLSQIERVIDAYVAPSKTFTDIRRSSSWWLPFLLSMLASLLFTFALQHEIGFQKVAESIVNNNPQMQERTRSMTPAQVQGMETGIATGVRMISYAFPVILLLIALISSGVLMASFNFGLGAQASFAQYLALWFYGTLPLLLKSLLTSVTLFAGLGADQFQMENPVGSNIGFYLGQDAPAWLSKLLSFADVFTIWSVLLLILGGAIIAKVKRNSAAIVVVGWFVLVILVSTVMAVLRG